MPTSGNDTITGSGQGDTIDAGGGDDIVFGLNGADSLSGNTGDDLLNGGRGGDTIDGGDDNDALIGGGGTDALIGGGGTDIAIYQNFDFPAPIPGGALTEDGTTWTLDAETDGIDTLEGIEIVVDGNGARVLLVGNGGFATIQQAVDAAASGDTIVIAAGVYPEQVLIQGKPDLRLVGIGQVTIVPPAGTLAVLADDPVYPTFPTASVVTVVDSDGIVIDNVDVDGQSRANDIAPGAADFAGISIYDSAATLRNLEVSGVRDPLDGGFVSGLQRGSAVIFTATTPEAFVFENNRIDTFQKTGLFVDGAILTMDDNTILGDGPQPIQAQNGADLRTISGTITDNEITGIGYAPGFADEFVATALFVGGGEGVTITGNTLTGAAPNGSPNGGDAGLYVYDSSNVTATGNTLTGFDLAAIDEGFNEPVDSSNNLTDNTFVGNEVNFSVFPLAGQDEAITASGTAGTDDLTGADGADTLNGMAGDDSLSGAAADDSLTGGAGNDSIDGGAGLDTANYTTDPTLAATGTTWTATDAGGIDTLEGVEFVQGASGRTLLVGSGGFASLQDAIDEATAGDTILLAGIDHTGQFVIGNKTDLTIIGLPGARLLPPPGSAPFATSFNDPVGGRANYAVLSIVDSSGITIQGLTVDGDGQGARVTGGANYVGILAFNSEVTIDDVDITGTREALEGPTTVSGNQRGLGLLVSNTLGAPQDFAFTNGSIVDYQKNAMVVRNADVDISGNTITGSGPQTIQGQNGIQLSSGSTGSISGNTISGIAYAGPQNVTAVSILVFDSIGGLAITGNTVTGPGGAGDTGIYLIDSANVVATDNTLTGFDYAAIDLGNAADLSPTNELSDNTYAGNAVNIGFFPRGTETTPFAPTGSSGPDELYGALGDDTLGGSLGADTLAGGDGNDTYLIDGDETILELAGEGFDIALASADILVLGDNVEALNLLGTVVTGNGNAIDNIITGNNADNQIQGFAGDDSLIGGSGNDTLIGGEDDDTLNGGAGVDAMTGGNGNDTYLTDLRRETVIETGTTGTDIVLATGNFSLGRAGGVENLTLLGTAKTGTGNDLGNVITGNASNNRLSGAGGNDTIDGGLGRDTLIGGTGIDIFLFASTADTGNTPTTGDLITDFGTTDFIDLTAIDADPGAPNDQPFDFIGTAVFTAVGQVRYAYDAGRQETLVELNLLAGTAAEAVIRLSGNVAVNGGDFLL